MTIVEAGKKFREGSLTPESLIEETLARIQRENGRLNAFYTVFIDGARKEAACATRELKSGNDRGPLHGIPIGVKDLFDVAGHRTTAGAHPEFLPPPAQEDSEVVARLRAAGAVIVGMTALHEWAFGVSTNNPHFGPTRNPHDPERIPGGSSGGSAAALAAGLCLGAIGTDTGGSIRIPASLCGVVGLKPTYGLVGVKGLVPLSTSLDHAGPMASTGEDVFLILDAICGRETPATTPSRILIPEKHFFEEADGRVVERVRSAAAGLGREESVDLDGAPEAWQATLTILIAEAAQFHAGRIREHPDRFGGGTADRLMKGPLAH